MNKLDGLAFLKLFSLPTVQLIDYEELMSRNFNIDDGLSLRLSTKSNNGANVNLPSIHNCVDKDKIKSFHDEYFREFDIIIHKTVKPTVIGSISKYYINGQYKLIIEVFEDFITRKKGIVKYREIYTCINSRYVKSDNAFGNKYMKIVNSIKKIPFDSFDIEFVIEDDKCIFTDFYSSEYKKLYK